MIKTRQDLRIYLQEDAKRNGISNRIAYLFRLLAGSENACAFRYIKCMRHCEFHLNNSNNIIHKLLYAFYKLKLLRLGRKYSIQITPNTCGYGLRLMHLSGGEGFC